MTDAAERAGLRVESGVRYAVHGGEPLMGTLYRPPGKGPFPAIIALHGGGWRIASATAYQFLGPWLAERGYAVFAPVYRIAKSGRKTYPEAVHDVRASIQFVKGKASELAIDPERLALMGESAGGHLASLVALAGDEPQFMGTAPASEFAHVSTRVKAAVTIYGVLDLIQQWRRDLTYRLGDQQIVKLFLGVTPAQDRRLCFEASPICHVVEKNNATAFLVAWGTADDVVDWRTQSEPFIEALKQAQFFVRTCIIPDAPHYWVAEPLDEPGSYSALFAPRLLRFLQSKL